MSKQNEALKLALEAFKKIRDDKHSYWCIDEYISSIEKALAPIEMWVMKTDDADFWRWWKPYELKDCWRLELVARDAWIASKAALKPKEPVQDHVAWKPIETAPKDVMILVCLPRQMNLVVRAWYNSIHNFWQTDYEGEGGITRPMYFHEGDLWHPIPPLYTTPPKRNPLTDEQRTELRDAFAQALVSVYVCGRVWEAWNCGTMSQNDFQPAEECEELLDSLIEAAHGIKVTHEHCNN